MPLLNQADVQSANKRCVIYALTNILNGKRYIGKTVDLQRRLGAHMHAAASKGAFAVHAAMRKHGIENFALDVLCSVLDEMYIDELEIALIEQHATYGTGGYNMTAGGEGTRRPCSDETRKRISDAHIGKRMRPFSEEARRRMSAAQKGRKHPPVSPETRVKISVSNKGKKLSDETRARMSAARRGKKRGAHSDEARANMVLAWVLRKATTPIKPPRAPRHLIRRSSPEMAKNFGGSRLGTKHTPEARARMSASRGSSGRPHSEESRKKMSASRVRYLEQKKLVSHSADGNG